MGLFAKLETVGRARAAITAAGIDPFSTTFERLESPTRGVMNGRPVLLAGTNNYLGLTFDAGCIAAGCRALEEAGTGTTGSRMANGSYAGHRRLEEELADFYGMRSAIVFSTGFLANLGMIAALAAPGDVTLIDADCHASIYDGCRLSGADIIRFRHNDAADLAKRLRRLGSRVADTLVIVEGIYSMLGDRAPLVEITAATRAAGALLMVDEAHALGVLGEGGRGRAEEAGVLDQVDFIVGTFSKSLGNIGGYCVSPRPELEWVRYASRPYIYTASPSPGTIAATRAALQQLIARPELRRRLWENAARTYAGLRDMGFALGPEPGPVVGVFLPDAETTLGMWHALLREGVYVNLVLPPAAPGGGSLLRISLSAAHTAAEIDLLLAAFAVLRERTDLPAAFGGRKGTGTDAGAGGMAP
ncbi:MAG: aminotransferase class I/II-fold pyridoxal phosphate-dependent enzyme [Deltaproteobacteria bacterium]|nr:aminotransferase class I/II-fold pyridoxal phosphate-dependent enzyme [Candidatus Anaeroferrophillacea bacterium]